MKRKILWTGLVRGQRVAGLDPAQLTLEDVHTVDAVDASTLLRAIQEQVTRMFWQAFPYGVAFDKDLEDRTNLVVSICVGPERSV